MSRLPRNHLQGFFQQEAITHETLGGFDQHEQNAISREMERFGRHARIVEAKKTYSNLIIRNTIVKDVSGIQVLILNKLGEHIDVDRHSPPQGTPGTNHELVKSFTLLSAADVSQVIQVQVIQHNIPLRTNEKSLHMITLARTIMIRTATMRKVRRHWNQLERPRSWNVETVI